MRWQYLASRYGEGHSVTSFIVKCISCFSKVEGFADRRFVAQWRHLPQLFREALTGNSLSGVPEFIPFGG